MLKTGSIFADRYKILAEVGRGSQSVVYLALDMVTGKNWALKEVLKEKPNKQDWGSHLTFSLIAKGKKLLELEHANLPRIVDVTETEDRFFIVKEYIQGETLKQILETRGPLDQETVKKCALQLCDVMAYLHCQTPPVFCTYFKPGNLMLTPEGNIILVDFETGRRWTEKWDGDAHPLGSDDCQFESLEEMFLEVFGHLDARTSVFHIGEIIYRLLTGYSERFRGSLSQDDPALAGSDWECIIERCCQLNPDDRYQSCEELRNDLENGVGRVKLFFYKWAYKRRHIRAKKTHTARKKHP